MARDAVAGELSLLKRDLPAEAPAELSALLDVHLMLLHDESLTGATKQWIHERHYNAEWALSAQLEVLARQFDEMEDEYLRERKADLEQVVERLLRALARGPGASLAAAPAVGPRDFAGEDPLVLVANDIAPADMLQFKGSVFTGFVTDVGGRTSHTAIVARSMDIPAVVGAREASRIIRQDDWVVIDGDDGIVIVDPSPIVLEEYRFRQRQSELERERLSRLRHTPAVTLDGERVELLANIELPGDAAAALEAGAVGRRAVPQRVPVHEPRRRTARRGRAVRGLPGRGRGDAGPAGDDPHGRHRRRQAARPHVGQRTAPRARAEPGARAARDPLEPVGAGHVPPAAARDPARQRVRQGAAADPDGGAPQRGAAHAGGARARQAAARRCRASRSPTSRSAR